MESMVACAWYKLGIIRDLFLVCGNKYPIGLTLIGLENVDYLETF
jgi:hypothetical protein